MKKLVFALASVMALSVFYSNATAQGLADMPQGNLTEKTEEEKHNECIAGVFRRVRVESLKLEPRVVENGPLAPAKQDIADNEVLL
jgi:hypothetical protein